MSFIYRRKAVISSHTILIFLITKEKKNYFFLLIILQYTWAVSMFVSWGSPIPTLVKYVYSFPVCRSYKYVFFKCILVFINLYFIIKQRIVCVYKEKILKNRDHILILFFANKITEYLSLIYKKKKISFIYSRRRIQATIFILCFIFSNINLYWYFSCKFC